MWLQNFMHFLNVFRSTISVLFDFQFFSVFHIIIRSLFSIKHLLLLFFLFYFIFSLFAWVNFWVSRHLFGINDYLALMIGTTRFTIVYFEPPGLSKVSLEIRNLWLVPPVSQWLLWSDLVGKFWRVILIFELEKS